MCSGLRPDVVCSLRVFMLVDMFMLCDVQLVPDFGPMQGARPQLVRTSVRCRGKAPVSPGFGPMQFPDFGPMQGTWSQLVRASARCSFRTLVRCRGQGPG